MTGVELLERRTREVPAVLRAIGASFAARLDDPGRTVVVGVGMSEGPARFLVALLGEQGRCARYLPLSELCADDLRGIGDTLVVFSQGLSPNARFALAHIPAFRRTLLVTSVAPDDSSPSGTASWTAARARARGAELVLVPPSEEGELLLRVIGPAVATFAAALLCARDDQRAALGAIADAYERALARPVPSILRGDALAPMALVASGRYGEACHGLRCKLLEGLLVPEPPIWDALQIPHGPLQSFYDRTQTLLALERAGAPHEPPLIDRLARLLVPERHSLVRFPSTLPGLYAWFEHDAQLNALVIDCARSLGHDFRTWPAQGRDGALYDLAPEL